MEQDTEVAEELKAPTPEESGQEEAGVENEKEEAAASTEEKEESADAGEEESAAGAQGEEAKKPPRGVQKRLDELTREKYDWKREAEYWRDLAVQKKPEEAPAQNLKEAMPTQGKPNPDDFEDYNDYIDALTDFKVKQAEESWSKKDVEQIRANEQRRAQEEFNSKIEQAKSKYSDFEDVIKSATSVPCTDNMMSAMVESPDGPDIMYYLAKNPSEADRIARLSPTAQIREIGRLEARITSAPPKPPEPRRITQTKEPIKTLSGAGVTEKDPQKMSMEDYARWRMAQE